MPIFWIWHISVSPGWWLSVSMKLPSILLFLAITGNAVIAQDCRSYQDYSNDGLSTAELDGMYPSAIHIDTTIAVFRDRPQAFIDAWNGLHQDLVGYLADNDFVWGKPTFSFNRVYFSKEGKIDTYLFNFKTGEVDPEKQKKFSELLTAFAKDYKLRIAEEADTGFSQCGGILYKDKK